MEQQKGRVCLLALIGLPAAGKSTFSKWLCQWEQSDFDMVHVCYDDYLELPQTLNMDEFNFKTQRLGILKMLRSLIAKRKGNKDVVLICDDNHYYRSMRYKIYQLCRDERCAFAQIYIECALGEALERNKVREKGEHIPSEIVEKMARCLEAPAAQQQYQHWESQTLTLKSNLKGPYPAEEILQFLHETFAKGPPPQPVEDVPNTKMLQSELHQLDVQLRKRVGDLLEKASATEKPKKAEELNARRKQILKEIKEGNYGEDLNTEELNRYVELLQ